MKAFILSLLTASALAAPYVLPEDGGQVKRDGHVSTVTETVTATRASAHTIYTTWTGSHPWPKQTWTKPWTDTYSWEKQTWTKPWTESYPWQKPTYTKTCTYTPPPPPPHSPPPQSIVSASSVPTPTVPSPGPQPTGKKGSIASLGRGIAYSPYLNNGDCKTQSDVDADVKQIKGYGWIRTYGTDCNQTATVLKAAAANKMKLFAGIFDLTDVASEAALIVSAAKGDWSRIAAVGVGNEGVNDKVYNVNAAVSSIAAVRRILRTAGYQGPVVTVDTFDAMIANPALCKASDFAAANCHAFFDADITAEQAGAYVLQQAENVKKACGGMETVITESGWPSAGNANGVAVPSKSNQDAAIATLKKHFASNIVLFSAFNNYWQKNNAGTFGAEWYWGIFGNSTTSGPAP